MDRYQVTAPYVTVLTGTERGPQVIGLIKGAFVPEDAPAEWVERHLRKKMIEKLPGLDTPTQGELGQGGGQSEEVPPPPPAAPPESGPGSGKAAWVDYAVARGFDRDTAGAMSRDDLIAALRED